MAGQADRPATSAIAAAVFALLVAATLGGFAYAQRLKDEPLVLDKVVFRPGTFTPNADCRRDKARVRFRLTRADRADVDIVDLDDRLVRGGGDLLQVLGEDGSLRPISPQGHLPSYRFFVLRWDGTTDGGFLAPPGAYKLRVTLLDGDRELIPPGRFRLHLAPRRPRRGCARVEREAEGTGGLEAGAAPG